MHSSNKQTIRHARALSVAAIACAVSLSTFAQLAPSAGSRDSDTGFASGMNSQGGYSATVPMEFPPVRGGLSLPVEVVYGGNQVGAAGLGWDVPLSYVFRDTTFARHRPSPPDTFSTNATAPFKTPERLFM